MTINMSAEEVKLMILREFANLRGTPPLRVKEISCSIYKELGILSVVLTDDAAAPPPSSSISEGSTCTDDFNFDDDISF